MYGQLVKITNHALKLNKISNETQNQKRDIIKFRRTSKSKPTTASNNRLCKLKACGRRQK